MAVTDYYTIDGMIIGESTNGVRTDYLCDALGSVTATVDQNANVLNTYRYKPFGDALAKTGVSADPKFQWNGGSGYRATQLRGSDYYIRARHYTSFAAGWTTADPIWPGQSAFVYVSGRAVALKDSSGLLCPMVIGVDQNDPRKPRPCPPKVNDRMRAALDYFCSHRKPMTAQALADLQACALAMMKSPCKGYKPPSGDSIAKCLNLMCSVPPAIVCPPPPLGICNKSGDCSANYCLTVGAVLTIYVCPQGLDENCLPAKGCRTGDPAYDLGGFPSRGLPPFLTILIHEAMHQCDTCGGPKKEERCREMYTRALTICLIKSLGN